MSSSRLELARRLLALAGAALALLAIWFDSAGGGSYWSDRSTGVFLLVLGIASALSLASGLALRRPELKLAGLTLSPSRLVLAGLFVGLVLWGFYVFLPAQYAFDQLGQLGAGAWLGAVSGLLLVLGLASPRRLAAAGAGEGAEPPLLALSRLLAGAGFVAVACTLWFDVVRSGDLFTLRYWNGGGRHSLGIFLLCLSAGGLLLVAWAGLTRQLLPEGLALAVALVLVGLTAWYPVVLATEYIDTLQPAGWLALAGSLVAAAASALTLALERRCAARAPAAG
jgi:hypothetical protein